MSAPADAWVDYDYAFIRVVPHVHVGTFATVGVVVHARTAGFLDLRAAIDPARLTAWWPALDLDLVARALDAFRRVCAGGPEGGPIGLLPPSERFHWLTNPRSTVVQCSEVHSGRTLDPSATLAHLFDTCVERG